MRYFIFLFFAFSFHFCLFSQCRDSVTLNTGFNHSANSIYGIGDLDPYWQITQVPASCASGFTPPNPSIVILKDTPGGWADPYVSSNWLSFRADATFTCDNKCSIANVNPYRFERSFCILQMDTVIISIKTRFDNSACVFVDNDPIPLKNYFVDQLTTVSIPKLTHSMNCPDCSVWNDTKTFTSGYETRADNYEIKLNAGTHKIVVELRNNSSGSMGLNLFGSVRSKTIKQNFLCPDSCQRNGTISIFKVEDKNCNGLVESGEAGANWQFLVTGPGGFSQTVTTDNSGYAFANNITNFGTYTIVEINKPGWYPNNPSSGSYTVNVLNNQPVKLTFFNCPGQAPCCPVFRATKDSASCSIKWVRQQDPCTDTIRSISITLDNGNFGPGGITSTCTGLVFSPISYIGNNSVNITKVCLIPFGGNITANITAKDCTKPVLAIFKITMASGKVCSSEEILKCACTPNPPCCAKVQSLFTACEPMHDLLHGKFTITNLDPSSPICKVKISASPSPSFSNSGLMIDGTTYSGSFWNPMMIPAAGTISAMNSIMFSLATDISYTGNITITVMKCDSTMCTFTVKWKGKSGPTSTIRPVQVPLQIETGYGLSAYQFQLKGSGNNPIAAKYCSIGMDTNDCPKIFAISGAMHSSDSFPTYLEPVELAQMGNNNAFFGLCCPRPLKQGESSGLFNLVLKVKKEKVKTTPLRITLFDDEGGIIYSDTLIVNNLTTDVSTSIIEIDEKDNPFNENLISVYPNPAANDLTIEYILGKTQIIKLELFNSSGILVKELVNERKSVGLNQLLLDITNLTAGAYFIKMHSESDVSNVKFEVVK
ncbi:MAG: T9SS type A sorting domain-containing protein [Saprospiraceae bacterium]|nr:T9SS type A sorting domain-containing protein [Candidatus Vicinibacter affinis]